MSRVVYPARKHPADTRATSAADAVVRLAGALLALAIAAVHVADQGGVTALGSPHWLGWGFRFIEVAGGLTAGTLLLPRSARLGLRWGGPVVLGWAAGLLLGVGPFTGYLASRTVGLPGDPQDVGNWGYWTGTVSLFVEAALVVLSVSMLVSLWRRSAAAGSGSRGPAGPGALAEEVLVHPVREEDHPDAAKGPWLIQAGHQPRFREPG